MPAIIIKDFSWRQTSEFVILNVPLKGHPKKVDLFIIDNYVKISFPPFILELFLWANIVEKESKCILTEQEAIITLRKANISLNWPSLEVQDINNDFKQDYRAQALEHAQKLAEEKIKLKSEKCQHLQKEAVKEQISVNTATLNKIDAIRDTQRKEAMLEFEDWRLKAQVPLFSNIEGKIQENRKAYKPPLKWFKDDDNRLKSRLITKEEIFNSNGTIKEFKSKEIDKETVMKVQSVNTNQESNLQIKMSEKKDDFLINKNDTSCSEDSDSNSDVKKAINKKNLDMIYEKEQKRRPGLEAVKAAIQESSKSVPLPRKTGTINITFSERKFPTPARESSHVEEQEVVLILVELQWLQKQAEARRKIGFDSEDLRSEERDPQWLKDKGDDFFKVGNYLAAISAYTYGIKISDKMASLYVNRSAAHYALGNYYRCVEDCSKALELMEPKCESNRESRARCHARRGAALCKLSAPQHGIPELEVALELTPNNESIKHDVLAAKQYFNIKD
ncbi:hypothetical protein E2986_05704 [Frieseomelitta varia]|uniref:CS domain-containing protein n=1 Tax=Frieseomelitta varia TaxID=561572 RepID=A0A833RLL8_9HYME|nr:hypothetical protein E2986_05704 [Frieseomelitta varia]